MINTREKIAEVIGMMAAVGIPGMVRLGRQGNLPDKEVANNIKLLCEGAAEQIIELVMTDYEETAKEVAKSLEKLG